MAIEFRPAAITQSRLRMAIMGPSGGGKTLTSLYVAAGLNRRGGGLKSNVAYRLNERGEFVEANDG